MSMRVLLLPVALLAVLAGCGGSEGGGDPAKDAVKAVSSSIRDQVAAAQSVDVAKFPKPMAGQSLEEFGGQFETNGPQAIAASSVFRPPANRLAFGLLGTDQRFAYGKTVVYVQRRGSATIQGPVAAPADVLVTQPRFRSQQAASEKDPFSAIYETHIRTSRPGIYNVLVVSDLGTGGRIAATMTIQVLPRSKDRIPDVGERAPAVRTDTLGSVKGNKALLDTRIPPAPELARTSFDQVVGRKPVALLFATPQLCQSRVCGPVTDEMLQLEQTYGDRMTFIHQEVYVANDPSRGVRPPLARYHLPSEPWLFTVRADGTIAARLEGSIGIRAFESAIKAALRR